MESILTECPTCGSRLRLRDASLIGQILPCPKCHGMVLIGGDQEAANEPGRQLEVGHPGSADSQAVTSEAVSDGELAGQPLDPSVTSGSDPADASGGELGIPQSWESSRTRRTRQVAAIAALGIVALLASSAIFYIVVRNYKSSQQLAQQPPGELEDGPGLLDAERGDDVATDEPGPENVEGGEPQPEDAAEETNRQEATPDEPPDGSTELTGDDRKVTSGENDSSGSDPLPTPEESSLPQGAIGEDGNDSPDPFERAIAGMNGRQGLGGDREAEEETAEEALPSEVPEELRSMIKYLDLSPAQTLQPPPLENAAPQLKLEARAREGEAALHPEPANPVDIDRALRRKLSGIRLVEMPLVDAIGLFSQLSGAPISFDLKSMDAAGVAVERPVSQKGSGTLGELLTRLLEAHGCEYQALDNAFLMIRGAESSTVNALSPVFTIDDLPSEAAELIESVAAWYPEETLQVQLNPLRTELSVKGPPAARFELALVLEAIRAESGLDEKIPRRFTRRWLNPEPSGGEISGGTVPESPSRPLPVVVLLKQLATANDKQLLIDWPAAWAHGLTVTTNALPLFLSDDAAVEMTRLLEPYALEVYPDGDVMRITSRQSFENEGVIQTVPLPPGFTVERFEQQLQQVAGQSDMVRIVSLVGMPDKVIARLPRYLAEQLVEESDGPTNLTQK